MLCSTGPKQLALAKRRVRQGLGFSVEGHKVAHNNPKQRVQTTYGSCASRPANPLFARSTTTPGQVCLVLCREWGNMETIIGDYIGTTIGIHSNIPY